MKIGRKAALLLVDIQKGFDNIEYWGGSRNNPNAERIASNLLQLWRRNSLPIFHIQHCSTNPISPLNPNFNFEGNQFKEEVKPQKNEIIIQKKVNSAFIGTNLQILLELHEIKQLIICGMTTDHCVSTTVRMAGNLGYETFVVDDATATFDKTLRNIVYDADSIHYSHLASLNGEFATVCNSIDLFLAIDNDDYRNGKLD